MTEDEARAWVERTFDVPRETMAGLDALAELLRSEAEHQNLVSRATLTELWLRHIVDSAQLLQFAPRAAERWIDLGTGAGFPGLIVSVLHPSHVTLVEERRLRVEYLHRATALLGIAHKTQVAGTRVERLDARPAQVISARAFAPLGKLFELAARFSTDETTWILPKGRNAQSELEAIRGTWQGEFQLHPSLTDRDARIILARHVRRKR